MHPPHAPNPTARAQQFWIPDCFVWFSCNDLHHETEVLIFLNYQIFWNSLMGLSPVLKTLYLMTSTHKCWRSSCLFLNQKSRMILVFSRLQTRLGRNWRHCVQRSWNYALNYLNLVTLFGKLCSNLRGKYLVKHSC